MFDNVVDFIVLGALVIDLSITLVLLHFLFKYKRASLKISTQSNQYKNKSLMLLASNQMLKSINEDCKSEINDLRMKNRTLERSVDSLTDKLSSTQKKLQSFSKMLDDMKNS